jgi:cytochrome P450
MTQTALPKGPRSALTQLFSFRDPFPLLLAMGRDYSDPLTTPILGSPPMVLTWDPVGAKAFFSADPGTFVPAPNEGIALLLGRGSLFLMSGDEHKRTRKLLAPPFHGERMRAYGEMMRNAALRWTQSWAPSKRFPVLDTMQGITLDVIIEAIFGVQDPAEVVQLHEEILNVVGAFSPLPLIFKFLRRELGGIGPWARFHRHARAMQAHVQRLIDAKRGQPGEDILSLLLTVRDEDGEALTDQEIMSQLLTFVVAGHETTATTLAWALYELHKTPATLTRLQSDLRALGDAPAPDAVARLPYLEAVLQETMRLHPPVPLVHRKLTRDFELKGYTLPAGTLVGVVTYLAHHLPETYPDPFTFRPERFEERTFSPFEHMPFGGGTRRCVGAAFAMYEMKIVLATLLAVGPLKLDEPKPVRSIFRIGTYGPETGIRMTLLSRNGMASGSP